MAVGGRDQTLYVWNCGGGASFSPPAAPSASANLPHNIIHGLVWPGADTNPSSLLWQAGEDLALRGWDVRLPIGAGSRPVLAVSSEFRSGDHQPVALAATADAPGAAGVLLATGHKGDAGCGTEVALWDPRRGTRSLVARAAGGHTATVWGVGFGEGGALLSASQDGHVARWDTAAGLAAAGSWQAPDDLGGAFGVGVLRDTCVVAMGNGAAAKLRLADAGWGLELVGYLGGDE